MIATVKTVREIQQQPKTWERCLQLLRTLDLDRLAGGFHQESHRWVFVGCGTSYYLAQAAAASFTLLTGKEANALPASEILFYPQLSLPLTGKVFPILISRSGHTSEILAVAEFLRGRRIDFMAVTCDGNELATLTPRVIQLPVNEESTVMTGSFTSMLLAMQFLAAKFAGEEQFIVALEQLPALVENCLRRYQQPLEEFAQAPFEDIAVLGQGPLYPIASEIALKVMESSSSYAQYFHTLEFRHGPQSIVDHRALVVALIGEESEAQEVRVLREMKDLGASTIAIVNRATDAVRQASDFLVELSSPLPALSLLVAYVVWGQLFGSFVGIARGLNPDEPTNLTRVVTL